MKGMGGLAGFLGVGDDRGDRPDGEPKRCGGDRGTRPGEASDSEKGEIR